jgi:hypothetical protein
MVVGVEVENLVPLAEAEPTGTTLGEKAMEVAHLPAHPPTNLTLYPKVMAENSTFLERIR